MKVNKLSILAVLAAAFLLASGCATLDGVMYGNSGVFVSNQYEDLVLEVQTNNSQFAVVPVGQPTAFRTHGLVNGDTMLLTAVFKDKDGKIVGTDEDTVRIYYHNGAPFVRTWTPQLKGLKSATDRRRR